MIFSKWLYTVKYQKGLLQDHALIFSCLPSISIWQLKCWSTWFGVCWYLERQHSPAKYI